MDWMTLSGYRLPSNHPQQQPPEQPQTQQQTSPNDLLKSRTDIGETTASSSSSVGGTSMLDMWATSKGASEAASASNSSSSSIGGPSSTPPISGGDRGSISTPGSIKGLKNIQFFSSFSHYSTSQSFTFVQLIGAN